LWPGFSFQVYPGNVLNTYLFRPRAVDKTTVYRGWYSTDDQVSPTLKQLAIQDRDTTVAEDLALVNSVQRGLNSRGYSAGPLVLNPGFGVNSEHSVAALQEWVLAALQE
jgi:phenylpropionate dioxygenase-like ring-hydroxylating dioxygenase large terminal subunit